MEEEKIGSVVVREARGFFYFLAPQFMGFEMDGLRVGNWPLVDPLSRDDIICNWEMLNCHEPA